MKIVPYCARYKEDFIEMNRNWISQMFQIEPEDLRELSNIEPSLAAGGNIFLPLMPAAR